MIMSTTATFGQPGKSATTKKAFSRETAISIQIKADAAIVWSLLTNASDFPRWNSTVVSLEGDIAQGEKIRLKSTLDEKRTFKLKVKELVPEQKMVWGSGQGNRVYTLQPAQDGGVIFTMSEKIGSPFLPMYAKYIPPFDENFEQFANDLKKEAEAIAKSE